MTISSGSAVSVTPAALGPDAPAERPLNVLLGLEGLALGGCPINALDLGRELRGRGHNVHVFAIDEDVKVSLLPRAADCGFTPILLPRRAGVLNRAGQIRAVAASVDADITHVFGPWLGPAATAAMAFRHAGAAVVTNWTMENVFYTPRYTPVIVGTRLLRDELAPRHPGAVWLMEPPVDVVADAPDEARGKEFRRRWRISDDEVAVVVVGRVDAHLKAEGLRHAIRAAGACDEARLRLVVVGDGDAFEQIRTLAAEVNARAGRDRVLLTGALRDPRPAYDAADIALGMGGSALRVLAHGKPLVVLGGRGFAQAFEPATAGRFYEAGFYGEQEDGDPVRHLLSLLRPLLDEDRRRRLGEYGLSEVRARFGLQAGAARLEEIYRFTLAHLPGVGQRRVTAASHLVRGLVHERWRALRGGSV